MGSGEGAEQLCKHKVRFTEAYDVLSEPFAITLLDDHPNEERFVTIGGNASGILRVVVYTRRAKRYRIISIRRATEQERNDYEEKP